MDDNSKMPFGKYKGTAIGNIPGSYLLWLHNENFTKGELREYIINNLDIIKQEAAAEKKKK